jgi:starch synthase
VHPDPVLGPDAWQRAYFGHGRRSLTGITHTTASVETMSAMVDKLTAPLQPWDALICTSTAVKNSCACNKEYLRERRGIARVLHEPVQVVSVKHNL